MPKAVMIIAAANFRDEELLQPKKILEDSGIKVSVASTTTKPVKGMLAAVVEPDMLVSDIEVKDFDAVIFVGGTGSSQYWDDPGAHKIIKEALAEDKVLAAICIAPVTLANAGVLKAKRATVFASEAGRLKQKGADYTAKAVEEDGKIITANGPAAAKEFGQRIVDAIKRGE